jgi:hypothetical protein
MEFDELYATHGNSACKAAETLRLRNRVSYQAWYQALVFSRTGFAEGQMGSAPFLPQLHPSFCRPFRNLKLVSLCWSSFY